MGKAIGREVLGIAMCLAISFLGTAAFRVQFPAVSFYSRSVLKSSFLEIGLFTSSFMAARAVASIIAGKLYRRPCAAKALPPLGFALNAFIAYLYTLVASPLQIMALRAVQGVLNGLAWVTIQVVLGELAPPRLRATMYTLYFSVGSLGIVAANFIYAHLAQLYRRPYFASMHLSLALFATAALLSAALPYRTPKAREEATKRGGRGVTRFAISMVLLPASISIAMALPSSDVIYVYVSSSMGMGRASVANLMALAMLVATVMGLGISLVADRVSTPLALRILAALSIASCASMPIANPIIFAFAIVLLVSVSRSFRSIVRKIAVTRMGPEGVGLVNASGNVGMVAGAAIVGWLYDVLRNRGFCLAQALCINEAMALIYSCVAVSIAAASTALARSSTPRSRTSS